VRTVILIPARYASSRYPGKPLVPLLGKPMILWVAEIAAEAVGRENVYIATEDQRIASTVTGAGFHAVMTGDDALTGTDRIAEAAESIEADVYLNLQGDEPLVHPGDILRIRDAKLARMDCIVNGYCWLGDDEDPSSVNIPKLITNEADRLVYMSRAVIPGFKEGTRSPKGYKKQVCIYAFTRAELAAFRAFGRKSALESCEDIEILRFLELGSEILMVETQPGSLAVDVPGDVAAVEAALAERGHHALS
jgi:3-deoxy-manno-octulosonate cytidylyltransferase (CMP-KDO synthetase)